MNTVYLVTAGIMIHICVVLPNTKSTNGSSTKKPLHAYNNWNTTIRPSETNCKEHNVLWLVTSYVGHVQNRTQIRTLTPAHTLEKLATTRIFLLAAIPQNEPFTTQKHIEVESNANGDILQFSFTEDYRNLTYKHLMGLRWASTECSKVHFIIKTDDDVEIEPDYLQSFFYINLAKLQYVAKFNFLMGFPVTDGFPIRDKQSKWYVSWNEYPRYYYPPYLKGMFYITTPLTAARLCKEAVYHRYNPIDDVFVTGILAQALNFVIKDIEKWHDSLQFEYYDYDEYF